MDSGKMIKNAHADMSDDPKPVFKTRLLKGRFPGREFDIAFWQEQGDNAIFRAAWDMVVETEKLKHGREPAFQRTVTVLKRGGS
jgi:hypothetical protein